MQGTPDSKILPKQDYKKRVLLAAVVPCSIAGGLPGPLHALCGMATVLLGWDEMTQDLSKLCAAY